MSFKFKTLVAALTLAAAGQAFATIDNAETNVFGTPVTTGGSEVMFYVWDSVAGASFTFDTGIKFEDFRIGSAAANASQSFSFASLPLASEAYNSYLSAIGNDFSNSTWGVVGLRSGSAGGPLGSVTVATTVRDNQSLVEMEQVSGALKAIKASINSTLLTANTLGHAAGDNLTGDFAVDGSNAYWGTYVQEQLGGKLVVEATNFMMVDADMDGIPESRNPLTEMKFFLAEAQTANSLIPQVSDYNGTWSYDGATLSYAVAAVPEPETYAMLLAGLGMLGAVARRRRAK